MPFNNVYLTHEKIGDVTRLRARQTPEICSWNGIILYNWHSDTTEDFLKLRRSKTAPELGLSLRLHSAKSSNVGSNESGWRVYVRFFASAAPPPLRSAADLKERQCVPAARARKIMTKMRGFYVNGSFTDLTGCHTYSPAQPKLLPLPAHFGKRIPTEFCTFAVIRPSRILPPKVDLRPQSNIGRRLRHRDFAATDIVPSSHLQADPVVLRMRARIKVANRRLFR
ncbi:hypothetical protein V9T40_011875 [Parthenolecanium corni]|uniref:Uncharacterized protein n=1 Tax=Parthenolecanium corni TaxID=536013 RepID=A0AAN9T7M7_9HEMI